MKPENPVPHLCFNGEEASCPVLLTVNSHRKGLNINRTETMNIYLTHLSVFKASAHSMVHAANTATSFILKFKFH